MDITTIFTKLQARYKCNSAKLGYGS